MSNDAIGSVVTVITMIVVVAIVAVIVSKNAQTAQVLQAGGAALSGAIKAAVGPVTASTTELGQLGH
jgi:Na+-translocating ferredoxin:NAD+ oxidoreductase RnfD subunit